MYFEFHRRVKGVLNALSSSPRAPARNPRHTLSNQIIFWAKYHVNYQRDRKKYISSMIQIHKQCEEQTECTPTCSRYVCFPDYIEKWTYIICTIRSSIAIFFFNLHVHIFFMTGVLSHTKEYFTFTTAARIMGGGNPRPSAGFWMTFPLRA